MDCERARQGFVDALTGNPGGAEIEVLRAHIAGCEACQVETAALGDAWGALDAVVAPSPPPSLPERFAWRARLARAAPRRSRWWGAAGGLAASLTIGFALGYGWQGLRSGGAATIAGHGQPAGYLMLLRADPSVPPSDVQTVYDEYAAWAGALAREGRLVSAEELADEGAWLVSGTGTSTANPPPRATSQPVVGFFWIRAESLERAVDRARESPHFLRGGTIEIRPIQRRP